MGSSATKLARPEVADLPNHAAEPVQPPAIPLVRYSVSVEISVYTIPEGDTPSKDQRLAALAIAKNPYTWADYIHSAIQHALETDSPAPIFNLDVRVCRRAAANDEPGVYVARISWIGERAAHAKLRTELEWSLEDRLAQYGLEDLSDIGWTIGIISIVRKGVIHPETMLYPVFWVPDEQIFLDLDNSLAF